MKPSQAISLIDQKTSGINWSDLSALSTIAGELAQYLRWVGEGVASARKDYESVKIKTYKQHRLDSSQEDAKKYAEEAALEHKYLWDQYRLVYDSTDKLISTIQTKLKYEKDFKIGDI